MPGDPAPPSAARGEPAQAPRRTPADRLLEWGWLGAAVLVPAVINPWGENIFALPKAVLLRAIVLGMLLVWIVDAFWSSRSVASSRLAGRSRSTPLFWPAVTLAAVIAAATVWATDPSLSFWGSYERSQGAVTLVCLPILGLFVATRLRGVVGARTLFWALSISILVPALYASQQAFGADPLGIVSDARSQIFGTLGRSNFLSAYAAMLVPLAASLYFSSRRRWLETAAVTLGVLALGIVMVTQTRAGVLSVVAGVLCWVGLAARHQVGRAWERPAIRITGAALLVLGAAGGLWLARLGGSGAARLATWQAVLELVAKRPLLGYGPDSLGLVFPRVYPPELVYYQGRGLGTDRAHNLFLDWSVSLGVLGLFAAAVVAVVVFGSARRGLMGAQGEPEWQWLIIGAVAALVGHAVGTLFSFDVWSTMVCTWLLIGVVVALGESGERECAPEPEPNRPARAPRRSRLLATLTSGVVAAAVLGAVVALCARPLLADVLALRSGAAATRQLWPEAFAAGERAILYWPAEPRFRAQLGRIHLDRARLDARDREQHYAEAERLLEEAVARRPDDFLLWTSLANVRAAIALELDRRHVARAEEAFRRTSALAPNHGLVYLAWGRFRLRTGDTRGAAELLRRAVELDSTDADAWLLLADLELRVSPTNALVMFRQAAKYAPHQAAPLIGLARTYWLLGQPEAAIRTLREALELDPLSPTANELLDAFSAADDSEADVPG